MDEPGPLDIGVSETGDTHTVRLRGELDLASVPELAGVLQAMAGPKVVVDLSELTFIDSSGVSALVRTQQRLAAEDRSLVLARPSGSVSRVFDILGISFLLDTDNSD
jgi:anti-anti-sigma factor